MKENNGRYNIKINNKSLFNNFTFKYTFLKGYYNNKVSSFTIWSF